MRIGFDGKRATLNFRGLGNYSRGIIEGLNQYTNNELFLYTSSISNNRARHWLKGLDKIHIQLPETTLSRLMPAIWRSNLVLNDLKKDKIELYHGLSHEIPFGIEKLPLKSVVTIHDLIFMKFPEFFPWIDRQTYLLKFKYSTQNANLVIAICEQTKNDLIELLGVDEKKIAIHYQSCDPIFYNISKSEEIDEMKNHFNIKKPYILNVGAFEERKNQKNLISAFAKICHKIEQDLILVGNGKNYLAESKRLAIDLKINSRVHFLSNVDFHYLPSLYQGADLFCFPSFYEGFGIPITEALFSKIPVITSVGSCFPESAGPHSLFIDPHSINEIADKMYLVLSSLELKNTMITKGFEFVQKFHRKNSTEELSKLYRQVI